MGGEIKVGMKFGTYDATYNKLSEESYDYKNNDRNGMRNTIFYDKNHAQKAVAMRSLPGDNSQKIKFEQYASIEIGSYTFSSEAQSSEMLNKFTRIDTATQYAIDNNGNGIVDVGEIFDKPKQSK